jgi:hypothetical protein
VCKLLTNVAGKAAADAAEFKVVLDILARSKLLASAEDLADVPEKVKCGCMVSVRSEQRRSVPL